MSLHQQITADWRQDPRAAVILASFATRPISQTIHFTTYVITRDEFARYEGYRVECLEAIYAEHFARVNKNPANGDWSAFDAFMAQPNPQDAIYAVHHPEPSDEGFWTQVAAQLRPAQLIPVGMAA
jgi:hypothetical protein